VISDYLRGMRGTMLDMYRQPDNLRDACEKVLPIMIEVAGKDGGFIMSCRGVLDEAKPEKVKAMFDFTKEYGVYH
jgi:hypothetical protein